MPELRMSINFKTLPFGIVNYDTVFSYLNTYVFFLKAPLSVNAHVTRRSKKKKKLKSCLLSLLKMKQS